MNNCMLKMFFEKKLAFVPIDINKRKQQELYSLERIKKNKNYLMDYNMAIRYMFLYFLDHGYDIPNNKVHLVFKLFSPRISKIPVIDIVSIIDARHKMKYSNLEPKREIKQKLSVLLSIMRQLK